jgi:hypothetical protein
VTPYTALTLAQQTALQWLCQTGGRPFVSDLPALAGLERDGLARKDADCGEWSATDKGRGIWHGRGDPMPWGTYTAASTDPFYVPGEGS